MDWKAPSQRPVRALLQWQSIFCVVAILLAIPFGWPAAMSAGVGCIAAVLGTLAAALVVFRRYTAQRASNLLMRFYGAEILKIAVVLVFFSVAFLAVDRLSLAIVLGCFIATQIFPALIPPGTPSETAAGPSLNADLR